MKLCGFFLSFLLCVFCSSLCSEEFLFSESALDSYIEKGMASLDVPGVAIAIVNDGKICFIKGYGVRKVKTKEVVDENTIFSIGSCTKAFTAAALSILADEKKLSFDDAVLSHLKSFRLSDPYVTQEITIKDLLLHRSGLERADLLWYGGSFDRKEIISRLKHVAFARSFRSEYGYNNLMYLVAGELIPILTSQSWDGFIQQRFFLPLEMTRSGTTVRSLNESENVASPHQKIQGEIRVVSWANVENIAPAAAINSTASDMAKWVQMLLQKGIYKGTHILNAHSIEQMFSPQIFASEPWTKGLYPMETDFFTYGFGWRIYEYLGNKIVEHAGCVDGMGSLVVMIPEKNFGMVILTNRLLNGLPYSIKNHLFDIYLCLPQKNWNEKIGKEFSDFEEKAALDEKNTENERVANTQPSLPLEEYVGTFHNDEYGDATIFLQNGELVIDLLAFHCPLMHWHFDAFRFDPSVSFPLFMNKPFVNFRLNAKGKVENLQMTTSWALESIWKKVLASQ